MSFWYAIEMKPSLLTLMLGLEPPSEVARRVLLGCVQVSLEAPRARHDDLAGPPTPTSTVSPSRQGVAALTETVQLRTPWRRLSDRERSSGRRRFEAIASTIMPPVVFPVIRKRMIEHSSGYRVSG